MKILGSYHCSLPEIDAMVDTALSVEGVAGAQLAGAGLGGCMMTLVRRDAVANLIKALKKVTRGSNSGKTDILICEAVAGAGILLKNE